MSARNKTVGPGFAPLISRAAAVIPSPKKTSPKKPVAKKVSSAKANSQQTVGSIVGNIAQNIGGLFGLGGGAK